MLQYNYPPHNLYTSNLIAGVSKRGNKNAQVYALSYRWTHTSVMQKKKVATRCCLFFSQVTKYLQQ